MIQVHVVGIGLDGAAGLVEGVRQLVSKATLLIGSERHLSYFQPPQRLVLGDLTQAIKEIRCQLSVADGCIVVLVTGDPLFLG